MSEKLTKLLVNPYSRQSSGWGLVFYRPMKKRGSDKDHEAENRRRRLVSDLIAEGHSHRCKMSEIEAVLLRAADKKLPLEGANVAY